MDGQGTLTELRSRLAEALALALPDATVYPSAFPTGQAARRETVIAITYVAARATSATLEVAVMLASDYSPTEAELALDLWVERVEVATPVEFEPYQWEFGFVPDSLEWVAVGRCDGPRTWPPQSI